MNKIFVTVILIISTSFVYGQQSRQLLYNTGNMCVKGVDGNRTTLYIAGDLVSDNQPSTQGGNIHVGGGKIVLKGNLRHNAYTSSTRSGYSHAFSRIAPDNGKLEFRGISRQEIYSDSIRSSSVPFTHRPSKSTDYILFPDSVELNNGNGLVMDARMAGEIRNAVMTKGLFILDSRFPDVTDLPASGFPVSPSASYSTMIAHLKITGKIKYPYYDYMPSAITDYNELGRFQVNLSVNPVTGNDDLTSSYGFPYKRMYGMASPYDSIRSDYFMFNTLALPDYHSFLGIRDQTMRSPEKNLTAGRGFFIGIDLRGSDENAYKDLIDDQYATRIMFDNRAKNGYIFNRFKFMGNPNNLYSSYSGENIPVYKAEKPVTDDMTVDLEPGYNYLGNSFLAPLSVKELVTETAGNVVPGWNIRSGNNTAAGRQVMNRVWISNPNTRAFEEGQERG